MPLHHVAQQLLDRPRLLLAGHPVGLDQVRDDLPERLVIEVHRALRSRVAGTPMPFRHSLLVGIYGPGLSRSPLC